MNTLQSWYKTLQPRERVMVVIGVIAIVLAVFYYGIWQPLNNGLADAREQVVTETAQSRWMLGLLHEAQALRASDTSNRVKGRNQSLLTIIDATSRARGLAKAVRRIQPSNNNEATVTLDAAPFNALLNWLHMLKQGYSVDIDSLTVTRGKQPGLIQARMKLTRADA